MPDLIGQSLGRYHILEQLGEGGMATVYKAYDTRLERDVAVKVIRRGAFPAEHLDRILKRFEREAKALAKLSHPNIIKVIDYGDHESSPYLVMEYLSGGTLKQRMGKPIQWQEAIKILTPVTEALGYAHENNIIHRDIKPSNILLTSKGQPMLTDFGIAKILEVEETATLTGTGIGVGTPEYMAPEQWIGQTLPQSDVYSLGVVLYEMLTEKKPYTADTPAAILLKQASEPLTKPSIFVRDLPGKVENILIKMLAKDPKNRYQNAEEVAIAFQKLTTNPLAHNDGIRNKLREQVPVHVGRQEVIERRPSQTPVKNRRWLAVGIIGIVLAGLSYGILGNKSALQPTTLTATPLLPASPGVTEMVPVEESSTPESTPTSVPTPIPQTILIDGREVVLQTITTSNIDRIQQVPFDANELQKITSYEERYFVMSPDGSLVADVIRSIPYVKMSYGNYRIDIFSVYDRTKWASLTLKNIFGPIHFEDQETIIIPVCYDLSRIDYEYYCKESELVYWNFKTNEVLNSGLKFEGDVLAISSDAKMILWGSKSANNYNYRIYDVAESKNSEPIFIVPIARGFHPIWDASYYGTGFIPKFTPDNKSVAIVVGNSLWINDMDGNEDTKYILEAFNNGTFTSFEFSLDGEYLVTSSQISNWDNVGKSGNTAIWQLSDGEMIHEFESGYTFHASLSPDNSMVVISSQTGTDFWDLSTFERIYKLNDLAITQVEFTPDGKMLIFHGERSWIPFNTLWYIPEE